MNESFMQAVRVHRFGAPGELVLEEVPRPTPERGEVLVKVRAAGVGPWDAWVRAGRSALSQTVPLTPGSDIAGVVVAVGPEAAFHPGDEVYGVTNPRFTGGYAEYAVATAAMLAHKPKGLDFIEAAAVPVVAVTAWQMLFEHARVQRNQVVVIHGGAGNVGAVVVQMARGAGARVFATGRPGDAAALERLGVEAVIELKSPVPLGRGQVDAVIDTVGGPSQEDLMPLVKRGGCLVSAVGQPDETRAGQLGVRSEFFIVNVTTRDLERISVLWETGELSVRVGAVLELAQAREAHEMLEGLRSGQRGKIVLRVS